MDRRRRGRRHSDGWLVGVCSSVRRGADRLAHVHEGRGSHPEPVLRGLPPTRRLCEEGQMRAKYARRHNAFGWWLLFVSSTLGLLLELLHGFKVQAYLAVSNETRRLMWTLAHAHGVLIALVNLV